MCVRALFAAPDGSIKSLVGVSSDITARKVAEIERENLLAQLAAERTALADLTATLEQRVEQRTAELMKEVAAREKAQEQLRQAQKMETIGQLTGGVAHDFNNLLMAVIGNLDLLRKRMPDDPRLHRLIDGALQGAERGASLTQRLLAFARQQDLRAVSVDLRTPDPGHGRPARSARWGRASRCGWTSAKACRRPASMPTSSSSRYSTSSSTRATPCPMAADRRSRVAAIPCDDGDPALPPGDYVQLSVIDTGTGMDAGDAQAGDRAVLLDQALGKGTGLGLSMVHGLAVQLGGALRLSSTVGKGTSATLVLPVADAAPEAEIPPLPAQKPGRSAVILFVDDDPLIAMSTTEMLEDLGHRVIGANSGLHALDIIKSGRPIDLMVTDHVMPGMTGIELAAAARALRPSLPILLATGYAELPEGTQVDLPRLAKPYHQDQLRDRLDQMLAEVAPLPRYHSISIG